MAGVILLVVMSFSNVRAKILEIPAFASFLMSRTGPATKERGDLTLVEAP